MNKKLVFFISMAIFGVIVLSKLLISPLKNQEVEIKVGDSYLHSLDYDNEDPFEEVNIDTVKVVSIKQGYVQWEYKDGFRLSGKLKYFKHRVRIIPN